MVDLPDGDGRITRDPEILGGKPVIRGMRVPVSLIVGFIEAGDSIDDILDAYPGLTPEDIEAALSFVASERVRVGVRAS
jgi:uncharacterized protein (DUF433 family)